MPIWIQYILAVGALVGAVGVIWSKVIKPTLKFFATAEEMLPLLKELTAEFKGTPDAFKVLDEIVAQFRTDSGSSLRDVVNRLDDAAKENRAAAEVLKVGVESQKLLAEQDRKELQRLVTLLDRLTVKVEDGAATSARIEEQAADVADDLAAVQKGAVTEK